MATKFVCRIESVEIKFPAQYVNGITKDLRKYFKKNKIGRYRRYVQTALIKYGAEYFTASNNIGNSISELLDDLIQREILHTNFKKEEVSLFQITLQFNLPYPGLIFCSMKGFKKSGENIFSSLDHYVKHRVKKEKGGSKYTQYSFISVKNISNSIRLNLCFSRKYLRHLTMFNLFTKKDFLIQYLLTLGRIYLTQVTCPDYFIISKGYFPYFDKKHQIFLEFLKSVNWFSDLFKRLNVTKKYLRGVL